VLLWDRCFDSQDLFKQRIGGCKRGFFRGSQGAAQGTESYGINHAAAVADFGENRSERGCWFEQGRGAGVQECLQIGQIAVTDTNFGLG